MKLVCAEENIELHFVDNEVNILVIENPEKLSELVYEIYRQSEGEDGRFVLSQTDTVEKIHKSIIVNMNPLTINFMDKKIVNKLYQVIREECSENMLEETSILTSAILQFFDLLIENTEYTIDYEEDYDLLGLFKLMNLKIGDYSESLCEKIVEYLKIVTKLCNYKIVVFLNLKSFLSKENLEMLYEFAFYNKIYLLLIESTQRERLSGEKMFIVDKDLCIISK